MKITKETTQKEILETPGGEEILVSNHVPCPNCPYAAGEIAKLTIGHVSRLYGLDLDKILKELNALN
jgi:hypothetical protein